MIILNIEKNVPNHQAEKDETYFSTFHPFFALPPRPVARPADAADAGSVAPPGASRGHVATPAASIVG